jgi:hypothetical protein
MVLPTETKIKKSTISGLPVLKIRILLFCRVKIGLWILGSFFCFFYKKQLDKIEKKIFLNYQEIKSGAVADSYMRKGFLIYEEMRKFLVIQYMRRP